ncbi:MAG: hypothetical protein U5O39_16680 [Gammaproteobacteria bacterium]|nr:hypothetical protein [Gammaproteobacteria bacterium]
MKSDCIPHQIDDLGEATPLDRIPLDGHEFSENELQALLHRNPSILPVSRFDGDFGPIVSLGREILKIDNLFVSPSGRLTVVETKLWRNPQATREVLAQILEYASKLSLLSCEALEKECHEASQSPLNLEESLYDFVERAFPGQAGSEHEFLDNLQRSLKDGRFLLLVVGDGIRENLTNVLDSLYGQSRLTFTFGLVELQFFKNRNDGGYIVLPNIPARSVEVVRAIVKVSDSQTQSVTVETPSDEPSKSRRLTEQEFLERMKSPEERKFVERLIDWAHEHAQVSVTATSMAVRLPFSTTMNGLLLMRVRQSGGVLTSPPRLRTALNKSGVGDDEVFRIAEEVQKLFPTLEIRPDKNQLISQIQAREIVGKMDEFLSIYTDAIERLRKLDPQSESASVDLTDEDSSEGDDDTA